MAPRSLGAGQDPALHRMAELSRRCRSIRTSLSRLSAMLAGAGVKPGAPLAVPVPQRRPFAPSGDRDDPRRLGAVLQHLGRIRRTIGLLAPPERRRRMEGGKSSLGADLTAPASLSVSPKFHIPSCARVPPMGLRNENCRAFRRSRGRERRVADAILATLLRKAARGTGRGHLQQLVRTDRARIGWRRSGAPLRADPIS